MALLYNEKCHPDYEPPMFKAGNDETFKMLQVAHTDEDLGMNTTHHGYTRFLGACPLANVDQGFCRMDCVSSCR